MSVPFHQSPAAVRGFLRFSRVVGVTQAVTGLLTLVGWAWQLPWLAIALPGQPGMRAGAALGFLLGGVALLFAHDGGRAGRLTSVLLSAAVGVLAAVSLALHAEVQWVIALVAGPLQPLEAGRAPTLMAELAALGFLLLGGLGVLAALRRATALREACALGVIAVSMSGMGAYGFVLASDADPMFAHVPLLTMVMLLMAALGWMSSTPTEGLTRVATADTLGGTFARRLLLPSMLLPVAYTFAFKTLQAALELSDATAFALAAVFTGGTVAWLVWWVAALLDRVERERRELRVLRTTAVTDTLTGLANRRGFDGKLERLVRARRERGEPFALMLLDVDHFKSFNDTFGHPRGDEALRTLGAILRAAQRPSDLVARYGGEEFAILLPQVTATQAEVVAARVGEHVRRHTWPLRPITVSIGLADAGAHESGAELLKRADTALYQAKRAGRDRFVVADEPVDDVSLVG